MITDDVSHHIKVCNINLDSDSGDKITDTCVINLHVHFACVINLSHMQNRTASKSDSENIESRQNTYTQHIVTYMALICSNGVHLDTKVIHHFLTFK